MNPTKEQESEFLIQAVTQPSRSFNDIRFSTLDLVGMDGALSGRWIESENRVEPHWLNISQEIPYWHGYPSTWHLKNPQFYWIVATIPANQAGLQNAVGLIELQVSPYDTDVIWLKNIGVHADWRNQGVASRLIEEMAWFLADKSWLISRSRCSDDGKAYIKARIDAIFDRYGIKWEQID